MMALAILLAGAPAMAGQTTPRAAGYSPEIARAYAPYYEGDATRARTLLEQLAADTSDPVGRAETLLALVSLCLRVADTECAVTNTEKFNAMLDSNDPAFAQPFGDQINIEQFLSIQAMPWGLYEMWLAGDGDLLPEMEIVKTLNRLHKYFYWPESYLTLQGVLALEYYDRGDFHAARMATRKLSKFAVDRWLHDPAAISGFVLARYLSAITASLSQTGDSAGAARYLHKFDSFILENLPAGSFEKTGYLLMSSEILAGTNDANSFARAIERLELAAASARASKIDDVIKKDNLAIIRATQTIYCIIAPEACLFNGEQAAPARIHAANPHFAEIGAVKSAPRFATQGQFMFALADILLTFPSDGGVDPAWAPHFADPLDWETDSESGGQTASARLFGKGLIAMSTKSGNWLSMLTAAASKRIDGFEAKLFGLTGAFPLPNYADRAIVGMAIDALAERDDLTPAQMTLALKGMEFLQRGARHSRGDALSFIAGLEDEAERRRAQAWLQLVRRQNDIELRALELLVAAGDGPIAGEDRKTLEALSRSIYLLASEQEETRRSLTGPAGETADRRALPGLETIRRNLGPAESMVANASFYGKFFKICVSADGFALAAAPDPRTRFVDIKILGAALTATHGPSEALDAQFPAKAAVRMKAFLLDGLGACLDGARRITYIPSPGLADLPLQALLEDVPPARGDGYDLGAASWLLKRFDIANASSMQEFLAARAIAVHAGGGLPFLGVGDPVLAAPVAEKMTGGEILALRGATTPAGLLTALPELPETGEELRAIAGLIPGARLLTRERASERRVRAEPLSQYNIISFATHGIIQGEIETIADAGLVLTPNSEELGDPLADGFLSATELAGVKLNARLVVLSACNTANFETGLFAQGMRGLTASLAISGVPAVLASLWPVDTVTGQRVMVRFFDQVTANPSQPTAASLARAVRGFVENPPRPAYSHPRFWAPFVLIGDGMAAPTAPSRRDGVRLSSFQAGEDLDGEFAGLAAGPGGGMFMARRGDWAGAIRASSMEMRGADGKIAWEVGNDAIGAVSVAAGPDRLYTGGYRANGDGTIVTPVVRAIDFEGTVDWTWQAPLAGGESAIILDLDVAENGSLWVLEQRKGGSPASSLGLYLFGAKGDARRRWTIPLPDNTDSFRSGQVAGIGDGAAVFFRLRPDYANAATSINEFGDAMLCPAGGGATMHLLRDPSAEPVMVKFLSGLTVNEARAAGSDILVAGAMRDYCDPSGYAYFGRVGPDGALQPIYREADFYRTSFTAFDVSGGRTVLAGDWGRRYSENLDYPSLEELLRGTAYGRSTDDYQFFETFFVALAPDGKAARHFASAGASMRAKGVRLDGNRSVFVGSVGREPLWAEIEFPRR
jgi:CHAT domain-containing protein